MDRTAIETTLNTIGLSEKESAVYLGLLSLGGEGSTIEASKAALLPRTTVYDLLLSLANKGLIVEKKRTGTKTFSVETPHSLYSYIAKQETDLEVAKHNLKSIMGDLQAMHNPALPVPSLQTFAGEEGILRMWDQQILESKGRDQDFSIVCNGGFYTKFQDLLKERSKDMLSVGMSIRVLVQTTSEDPIFMKIRNLEVKATHQKYIFAAGMDIIGSFIGYWTEMDSLTGMLLENEQLARMQKSLFEQLWVSADHK